MTKKLAFSIFIALILAGLFFRLWNISFGLPHSFYADEPEIAEPAIKYTYEIKDIIANNNYYKLIPVSFVYGTFPAYLMTGTTMFFSKLLNTLNVSFDKSSLYINMRVVSALISLLAAFGAALLYKKIFKDTLGFLLTFGITAMNWKLIVHGHYTNADIILTALLVFSFIFFYLADKNNYDNKNTVISAILFGVAVGTKFTALISVPMFLFLLLSKKDLKATLGFIFTALLAFMVTNPLSIIFFKDFSFRIFEMFFKEAGLVFDSVDSNPFKYISALVTMLGLPLIFIAFYGIAKSERLKENKNFHIFLLGNVLIYILFYSLQSRRVDRWLLPTLTIIPIYASLGIKTLAEKFPKKAVFILLALFVISYLNYPLLLLTQFRKDTPKSSTYKWVKANIPLRESALPYILVYTEEGLDPLNKVDQAKVLQVNVYESENAQLFYPEDPSLFEYVIISSRPMSNYERPEVMKKYPELTKRWEEFKTRLDNKNEFELIKSFSLSKPNLIPLSDVYIYQNLKYQNGFLVTKESLD